MVAGKVVSKHQVKVKPASEAAKTKKEKKKREQKTMLATYSCCYHAPCYYGVCDWVTWGQASRWLALCPSAPDPRQASCRHRPGTLPPAAEKPTYACYLAMIAHRKTELKEVWFQPSLEQSKIIPFILTNEVGDS